MDQKEFGQLIKKIRKENNLTQKDIADKYHVTYQAVSKWENGKNMPDIMLIKQISNDYNISMDNIFLNKNTKSKNKYIIISIIILLLIGLLLYFFLNKNDSFKFKTISSSCSDFNITGSMSYDDNKSVIYISNITYCDHEDIKVYDSINCSLFEKNGNESKELSKCNEGNNSTLEDYLKDISFSVDNHNNTCKEYKDENLYLQIYASLDGTEILYEIPLSLNDVCSN